MKKKQISLQPSLNASKNYDFIDKIHQNIIDLEYNKNIKKIHAYTQEYLSCLDSDINFNLKYEILSYLTSYFLHYQNPPNEIIKNVLKHSHDNPYRVILTAEFCYIFYKSEKISSLQLFCSFIKDSYDQIINQIQNKDLIIFNQTISNKHQANFIINILFAIGINSKSVIQFMPYIFSQEHVSQSKLDAFLNSISNLNLIHMIPETAFLNKKYFSMFTMDDITKLIIKTSDDTFYKILPLIEEKFARSKRLKANLVSAILYKCIKLNINFILIDILVNSLTINHLKFSKVWDYLSKFNIQLKDALISQISNFPNPAAAVKLVPNLYSISPDVFTKGILEISDYNLFFRAVLSRFILDNPNSILSNSSFWIHLTTVISNYPEKYSYDIINLLVNIFQLINSPEKFNEIFTEMIFNNFPLNNKTNNFLADFFFSFDGKYREFFLNNFKIIIEKVINLRIIPLPSFWEIICIKSFDDIFNNDYAKSIYLYAYEFSEVKVAFPNIQVLTISEQTDPLNQKLIIEFIEKNDLDHIVNMNEECLSLIINAFIYIYYNNNYTVINGLDNELILPFIAIGLIYLNSKKSRLFNITKKMSNDILECCNSLANNQSPLQIISINSILLNFKYFIDLPVLMSFSMQIIEILINHLLNNSYFADKYILLSTIFKLSCQYSKNEQIVSFLNKYGLKIFMYVVKNMDNISNIAKLKNYGFNLQMFNSKKILDLTSVIIHKTKSNNVFINAINFLERFCKNVPQIEIPKINVINRVLNESINQKNWDNVLIIGQFMKNNQLEESFHSFLNKPIPIKIKELLCNEVPINCIDIENIVNDILSDPEPESHTSNYEIIFKEMMKDNTIAMDYMTILFEKISINEELSPNTFLRNYLDKYKQYGDLFINSLRRVFVYHPTQKVFIRKAEYESISLPISKYGNFLISKLFKDANSNQKSYQIFFFLKNIALTFPFLFSQNPQKIFDLVLPFLNNFILYFTIQINETNEEIINKLKISLSALSFLYSTLYSIDILDSFVPWIFKNIYKFSVSQIFAFSFILSSLFKIQKIQEIMVGLAMKYKFIENFNKLMKINIPKEIIFHYKSNFYDILYSFYSVLNDISYKNQLIYIDEVKNMQNPFMNRFNDFSTIFPIELKSLNLPKPPSQISEFITKIDEINKFWITYNHSTNVKEIITYELTDEFIFHYMKMEDNVSKITDVPNIQIIESYNVKFVRFLAHQPYWIYNILVNYNQFSFLPEHIQIIKSTIEQMKSLKTKSKFNDINELYIYCCDININEFILNQYCQSLPIDLLLNDIISSNHQLLSSICNFIQVFINNPSAQQSFFYSINRFINKNKINIVSIKSIKKIVKALIMVSDHIDFKKKFNGICGNNLLDLVLSSECRQNSKLLCKVAELFINCKNNIVLTNICQFLGFVLMVKDSFVVIQGLKLCSKIGEKKIKTMKYIIENIFEKELEKENPAYDVISYILNNFLVLINDKIALLPKYVDIIIANYQKYGYNEEISNLICFIFNYLSLNRVITKPKFNEIIFYSSFNSDTLDSSSFQDSELIVKPISNNIKKENDSFLILCDKHRNIFNNILQNDENKLREMTFLFDFPYFLSFDIRYKYFKNKMKNKINFNNVTSFIVDRSNILVSTFKSLFNMPLEYWFDKFCIEFNGENGIDAGGLTKEWFTLVTKELFNVDYKLFISSEKKSYQPNPLSYTNPQHIEYFNFAGKFIARAIIQGINIKAHLMRSFIKQIFGVQLKFKDLEDFDNDIYKSLQMILENDVEQLDLNFTMDVKDNCGYKNVFLKNNGNKIKVTNTNKKEYVSLYATYHLRRSIIQQVTAFCEGFYSLISHDEISMLFPSELDLIICGIPEISIEDLKNNCVYEYPYHFKHPVIILFFNVISKWNNEKLAKFLLFLTGSSQVPVNGFKEYKDNGTPITIACGGNSDRLCVAHTCFNQLDLPEYQNEIEMNEKLLISIQECEFGLI